MKAVYFVLALLSFVARVQALTLSWPTQIIYGEQPVCRWSGGVSPYYFVVYEQSPTSRLLATYSGTSLSAYWTVNVLPTTVIFFRITDAAGTYVNSDSLIVQLDPTQSINSVASIQSIASVASIYSISVASINAQASLSRLSVLSVQSVNSVNGVQESLGQLSIQSVASVSSQSLASLASQTEGQPLPSNTQPPDGPSNTAPAPSQSNPSIPTSTVRPSNPSGSPSPSRTSSGFPISTGGGANGGDQNNGGGNGDDGGNGGSKTNVGAIAGGVVGGVVGLAAIAVLAIFLLRRQRNQYGDTGSDEAAISPDPPMAQSAPAGFTSSGSAGPAVNPFSGGSVNDSVAPSGGYGGAGIAGVSDGGAGTGTGTTSPLTSPRPLSAEESYYNRVTSQQPSSFNSTGSPPPSFPLPQYQQQGHYAGLPEVQ